MEVPASSHAGPKRSISVANIYRQDTRCNRVLVYYICIIQSISLVFFLFSGRLNITVSDKPFQSDLGTDVNCLFTIPQEILNVGSQNEDVTIAFNVFRQPRLFPSRDSTAASNSSQNSSQSVGSYVVSASINIIPDGTTLSSPVQYAMRLMNVGSDLDSTNITVNRSCVFWDFDGAGE